VFFAPEPGGYSVGFFNSGGKVKARPESDRFRDGSHCFLPGSQKASGVGEARPQQILPRGDTGLFAKNPAETRVSHAQFSGQGLQVDGLAVMPVQMLLGASHNHGRPRRGFSGPLQFRADSQEFVGGIGELRHGVWVAACHKRMQILEQFRDPGIPDILKNAGLVVEGLFLNVSQNILINIPTSFLS